MGGLLTQPETKKSSAQGEGLGLRYALSSMQGWRLEMEDAHDVRIGLKYGLDDWSFFAVFDGHAGKRAAAFAAWNLLDYILRDSLFELETGHWSGPVPIGPNGEKLNESDKNECENTSSNHLNGKSSSLSDERIEKSEEEEKEEGKKHQAHRNEPSHETRTGKQNDQVDCKDETTEHNIEIPKSGFVTAPIKEQLFMVKDAIRSGFLKTDQGLRKTAKDMSGSTAVCAFVSPTHYFIANCGDSRAVLYNGKKLRFVTEDHKPFYPEERRRIIDAGGTATVRINGTLAVSRALGDFEYKKDLRRGPCEQLVSPEPETTIIERKPDDEFLILACDGIWDVMSNEDLCEFVRYQLLIEADLEKICSAVLDVCLRKGSRDNMSIIIVVFSTGPQVIESEVERDRVNNDLILKIADSLLQKSDPLNFGDFFFVMREELDQHSLDLDSPAITPPGAGIEAKYDLLREKFDKHMEKCQAKAE